MIPLVCRRFYAWNRPRRATLRLVQCGWGVRHRDRGHATWGDVANRKGASQMPSKKRIELPFLISPFSIFGQHFTSPGELSMCPKPCARPPPGRACARSVIGKISVQCTAHLIAHLVALSLSLLPSTARSLIHRRLSPSLAVCLIYRQVGNNGRARMPMLGR